MAQNPPRATAHHLPTRQAEDQQQPQTARLLVRAVLPQGKFGYYGMKGVNGRPDTARRIKNGTEFELAHAGHFSHRWMQAIGWTPAADRPRPKSDRVQLAEAQAQNKVLASELSVAKDRIAALEKAQSERAVFERVTARASGTKDAE